MKLQAFGANVKQVIIKFYLMMAVIILAGFSGQFWLAFLALPIFLSGMLAVTFNKKSAIATTMGKNKEKKLSQAA